MYGRGTRQPDLCPANTYVVANIGDRWVDLAAVRVDPGGAVLPIRAHTIGLAVSEQYPTPSRRRITEALVAAWNAVHHPPLEFARFIVGLPSWCCQTHKATAEIEVRGRRRVAGAYAPIVTDEDIHSAEDRVCCNGFASEYCVLDYFPVSFQLNDRRVDDPLGETSSHLKLDAVLVLAERGIVEGVLKFLESQDIDVDVVASPFRGMAGALNAEERALRSVVIDVGETTTACAFFQGDVLCHASVLSLGADHVHRLAARALDVAPSELGKFVAQREALLSPAESRRAMWSLPLFRHSLTHPILHRLAQAAAAPAQDLFREVSGHVALAEREMMTDAERLVITGDDPLTLRALEEIAEAKLVVPCRARPPDPQACRNPAIGTLHHRTLSLARQCVVDPPRRQFLLETSNRSFFERLAADVGARVQESFRKAARRLREGHGLPAESTPAPRVMADTRIPEEKRRRESFLSGIRFL